MNYKSDNLVNNLNDFIKNIFDLLDICLNKAITFLN